MTKIELIENGKTVTVNETSVVRTDAMVGHFGSTDGSGTVRGFASGTNLNWNTEKQTRDKVACHLHLKIELADWI
jgi:hypothetical protein